MLTDTIIYDIGIPSEPKRVNAQFRQQWAAARETAKPENAFFNVGLHFARNARISSLKKGKMASRSAKARGV